MHDGFKGQGGETAEPTPVNTPWQQEMSDSNSAEETLQEQQGFIQRVVEAIPGLIYIYELHENRTIYTNNQISLNAILGYNLAEIQQLGSAFWQILMHPEDLAKVPGNVAKITQFKDSEVFEWEYRLRNAKGEWCWFLSRETIFLRDSDGSPKQILSTAIKISDSLRDRCASNQQAEARSQLKTQEWEAIFQALPDLYFWLDADGTYLDYQVGCNQNLYVQPEQFLGRKITEVLPPDIASQLLSTIAQVLQTQTLGMLEYSLPMPDGEQYFEARLLPLSEQQVLSVVRNITEKKQLEETLRQSEEKFRQITEHIRDVFWIVDPMTDQLLYISPAYEQIWGRTCSSCYENCYSFLDAVHPEDREQVTAEVMRRLEQKVGGNIQYRIVQPSGEVRWISDRAFPICNPSGEVYRLVGIAEDITEYKVSEIALQQVRNCLSLEVQQRTAELSHLNEQLRQEIAERHLAEETLREREERFRQLAENIESVFWMSDTDTQQIIYVSPAYEKIWGRTCADLYASSGCFLDAIHPEDRDRFIAALPKEFLGEFDEEYRIIKPDGSIRWIRDRAFPVRDASGRVYRLAGIAEDISDRKQAEAALIESERQLQTIVNNLLDGLLIVNQQGQVRFANPGAGRLFGYKPEELVDAELGWPIVQGEKTELTILRKGGEIGIGEMYVAPAQWKGEPVCVVSLRDITERRQAEQALRDSEERFRQMAEHIADVFWLISPEDNQLLYLSPAYERIWGRPREHIYSDIQSSIDSIHPEDRQAVQAFIARQRSGDFTSQEYRIIRPDGSIRWIWARAFPVKDEFGRLHRIAGVAEDISDRKEAEAQIKASLQEKELLLREIHHRVKNNMQVISSLLELQSQYIDEPQMIALFQESQNRIRSMALIHEQLYQSLHSNQIDFARYIKDLATNLFQVFSNHSNAIELKLNVASTSLNLETAIPCGLIVNELVSNSLKHAFPQGRKGEITVEFTPVDSQQFNLIVSDNGIGFPSNIDGETTETLGWRLVRMLTRQLKGALEVDKSRGARFKLTFSELKYRRRV